MTSPPHRVRKRRRPGRLGGPILSASSYFMKSPPVQYNDHDAKESVEAFIRGEIER